MKKRTILDLGSLGMVALPVQMILLLFIVNEYLTTRNFPLWQINAFGCLQIIYTGGFIAFIIGRILDGATGI